MNIYGTVRPEKTGWRFFLHQKRLPYKYCKTAVKFIYNKDVELLVSEEARPEMSEDIICVVFICSCET